MDVPTSPDPHIREAWITADVYLRTAVERIDALFGKGYAKQHPELIAAFMQAATADVNTAVSAQALRSAASEIAEALRCDPVQEPATAGRWRRG